MFEMVNEFVFKQRGKKEREKEREQNATINRRCKWIDNGNFG